MILISARHLSVGLGLCVASLAAGCGPGTLETKGDAAAAKATLAKVLDTWKAGQTPEDLHVGDPKIYASDEDWIAGRKLASYEILGDETVPNGAGWRVFANVTVTGLGATGKPQKVCYLVEPGSPSAVARSDTLY